MDVLRLLREGELEVRGRLTVSSNAALVGIVSAPPSPGEPGRRLGRPDGLLGQLQPEAAAAADAVPDDRDLAAVVYKPIAFERPLWDFPDGTLAAREFAAFLVSEASGWGIVPPTILREGPAGPGMIQLWLDTDPATDAWQLVEDSDPRLRPMALLDAVLNNTDRKGGHILALGRADDPDLRLHGVDHGVCFSVDPKLRTVLWAWRGTPIAAEELAVLARVRDELDGSLGAALEDLLQASEVEATRARLDALLETRRFPEPSEDWPAVPWPPY